MAVSFFTSRIVLFRLSTAGKSAALTLPQVATLRWRFRIVRQIH